MRDARPRGALRRISVKLLILGAILSSGGLLAVWLREAVRPSGRVITLAPGAVPGWYSMRPEGAGFDAEDEVLDEVDGQLRVPPGMEVILHVAITHKGDLSFLDHFAPGDLAAIRAPAGSLEGEHLVPLARLTGLSELHLPRSKISSEGLAPIADLTGLRYLDLASTLLDDEAIPTLVTLAGLQWLDLRDTYLTDRGFARLAAALPDCLIERDFMIARLEAPPEGAPPAPALQFPPDPHTESMILTRPWGSPERWRPLVPASGSISIPPGHEVMLELHPGPERYTEDSNRFSFLEALPPSSLQAIAIPGADDNVLEDQHRFDSYYRTFTVYGRLPADYPVQDDDLQWIERFTGIRELDLSLASSLTDEGLRYLTGLTSVQSIRVGGPGITDAGLEFFRGLTTLERLELHHCTLTDAGMETIRALTQLRSLAVRGVPLTDTGLAALAMLENLERLELTGLKATDTGLIALARLKNLERLELSWLGRPPTATYRGVAQLERSLPGLRIIHELKPPVVDTEPQRPIG